MRTVGSAAAVAVALVVASGASAQVEGVNLTGRYRCLEACLGAPGNLAFITQNGWDLNVVNDAGEPSRAWVDYPGRLWVERANQGAIYSTDGWRIQFDGGTIWQRVP